uniref:Thioredoxin domain-containing protein n=1 Tax=Chromera velia CCMP2878 TaxID=1169474 RepID=A0A0G4I1W7_9ALVE|eukprot:Cvel_34818.t1-p1 / transcript=Cvel_34818.t1 / gene=Cvel_34818 / organism=Chromera_velia_CCMP2878 / gene_product=Thioredoxin domain-containing protein 6, putative / transcript_product=Thioredoxin domain-containing protein 6, putative / location=Cvel_scaffold6114:2326-3151(-) / protein_length=121 / sequence_SO=supercontig / SO=protein_coding / is_pseudo=false
MPPKALQSTISDDDTFKATVEDDSDPRLHVVDVHATWCGPCKQMIPTWKSLQLNYDNFDDRINLVICDAEKIATFEKYKGTACPRFIFYKGGKEVENVEGANAPAILRAIEHHVPPLEQED